MVIAPRFSKKMLITFVNATLRLNVQGQVVLVTCLPVYTYEV